MDQNKIIIYGKLNIIDDYFTKIVNHKMNLMNDKEHSFENNTHHSKIKPTNTLFIFVYPQVSPFRIKTHFLYNEGTN